MTTTAELPAPIWLQLQQAALAKKNTFEGACRALTGRLPEALREPQGAAVLARARTLLRTRYTQPPAWVAGRQLFQAAAQEAAASGNQELQNRLAEYVQECNEFLGEAPEGSTAAEGGAAGGSGPSTSSGGYLFEGLLSSAEEQQQQAPRQLELLDLLGSALGQQLAAAQAAAQAAQEGGGGGGSGGAGADGQQQPQAQAPDPAQAGAQAAAPELPADVVEAIERELDAIAVRIMAETGQEVPRAAPPASKRVVASLPRERLTAERMQQLGGADVRCPVCMEELCMGEEVQVMPCSDGHVFHPPCLAPWLENNNSCPSCRHELETDDQAYERKKVREKEEEEERRGAANANSHSEFLYI